jgi:hypothetical protein
MYPQGTTYTFEAWIYLLSNSTDNVLYEVCATNQTSFANWELNVNAASRALTLYVRPSNGASTVTITGNVLSLNTWYHVAVSVSSGSGRLFINGIQAGSTTTIPALTFTPVGAAIGVYPNGYTPATSPRVNGYISNLRLVQGVAVYTTTPFVPSTNPLTRTQSANVNGNPSAAITGTATSLLTCQSNRFIDNSNNNYTLTPTGSPRVDPYFYPSGFTAPAASPGAALFNGSNQYLSTPSNAALTIGTSSATVEFWVYPTAVDAVRRITTSTNGVFATGSFFIRYTNGSFWAGSSPNFVTSATVPAANRWTHVAWVGTSGTSQTLYINGVSVGTAGSYNITEAIQFFGGYSLSGFTEFYSGYISNFRVVKGVAVYTANFTLPTAPLATTQTANSNGNPSAAITGTQTSLLLGLADSNYLSATNGVQNNTFIDNSNYAFPITRNGTPTQGSITPYWPNGQWSNYFNGSSYIRSPGFNFSTNNFSIECFLNTASLSAGPQFLGGYDAAGQNYTIAMNAGGVLGYFLSSDGSNWDIASNQTMGTVVTNRWHHIVIARTGNKIRSYFDGVGGTVITTSAAIYTNTTNFWLGAAGSAGGNLTGYLSNVRVLNGASAYDANQSTITVPTAPFPTNTTNQVLLTCQGNRFFDANTATTAKTITVTGTPRVQAFQPFSPTASYTTALYGGSGYFNGSTDFLTSSNSTALSWIGLNNGFVECWIYLTVASLSCEIVGKSSISGSSNPNWSFGISSGRLRLLIGSSGSPGTLSVTLTAATTLPLFTWVNVAAARNYVGGASVNVYTLYLNGVIDGGATGASPGDGSPNALYVGREPNAPRWMTGYISNLRFFNASIPSGYQTGSVLTTINSGSVPATGTVAFTPPTAPLTAITGTNLLLNMTNAGIYDAAVQNNAITVGDAQASSAITAQWPPTSIRFDPTTGAATDSLTMLLTPATTITSGNFTIEFWLNPSTVASATQAIIGTSEGVSAGTINWSVYLVTSSLSFQCYSNASALMVQFSHQTALAAGTWYYCALTRNGSTFTLYLNGVASTSTPTSAATISQSGTTLYVGKFGASSTIGALNGYLEDVRMTRGVARTIAPPPPTAPFPTR